MKRKILWLSLSCLMVLSLVLASCAPVVIEEKEETPPTTGVTPPAQAVVPAEKADTMEVRLVKSDGTTVVKSVEKPKYGGTFVNCLNEPIYGWDDSVVAGPTRTAGMHIVGDELLGGDWAKGPAGTEETNWWLAGFYSQVETGYLAESWEIPDANTIIFHLRKGIHWQNKPPVNGRELVADDVVYSFTRNLAKPASYHSGRMGPWFKSATATDKYTVVVKGADSEAYRTAMMFQELSDRFNIAPREVIQQYGDMNDWKNVVGTGPFIVVDAVAGSSATFIKNSNYWMKDPITGYQLPYVDKVIFLIITDASTRLAALRTGKIDCLGLYKTEINWENGEILKKTNPDLKWVRSLSSQDIPYLRVDMKPFDDIRVRQALHMAIDYQAIARDYYHGNADWAFPVAPVPEFAGAFTPLEKLPKSAGDLYQYNPAKAKQLLTEAGYPNGFKFSILSNKDQVDMLSIIKDYLAKIGVNMELDQKDMTVFTTMSRASVKKYDYAVMASYTPKSFYEGLYFKPGDPLDFAAVNDQFLNDRLAKVWAFENIGNQAEIDRLMKEYALHMIEQAYVIDPPFPYSYVFWQPWLKNFFGEYSLGLANYQGQGRYVWVDQELKKKMGY